MSNLKGRLRRATIISTLTKKTTLLSFPVFRLSSTFSSEGRYFRILCILYLNSLKFQFNFILYFLPRNAVKPFSAQLFNQGKTNHDLTTNNSIPNFNFLFFSQIKPVQNVLSASNFNPFFSTRSLNIFTLHLRPNNGSITMRYCTIINYCLRIVLRYSIHLHNILLHRLGK